MLCALQRWFSDTFGWWGGEFLIYFVASFSGVGGERQKSGKFAHRGHAGCTRYQRSTLLTTVRLAVLGQGCPPTGGGRGDAVSHISLTSCLSLHHGHHL